YRSQDGGSTWARVLDGETLDLEVDPRNFSRQFAGVLSFDPNSRGVYRTMDGGQTWTRIAGPWSSITQNIRYVEMAVAPLTPDTIYIGISYQGAPTHLYRSGTAWAGTPSWTELNLTSFPELSSSSVWELIVDPANTSILYIGGIDLYRFQ